MAEQDGAAKPLKFSSEKRWLEEYFPFENDNFSGANCQTSCGEFQYDETKKKEAIYLGDFGMRMLAVIWSPNVKICLSFREWLNVFGLT